MREGSPILPELSARLLTVVSLVPAEGTVADVGSDHGRLAVYLALTRGQRVIASDVSRPSLQKTIALAQALGAQAWVDCRWADGLSAIAPGEAQAAVIAGMGGLTIRGILDRSLTVCQGLQSIVLHPTNAAEPLRVFLREHGFGVTGERLALENDRIQPVFRVRWSALDAAETDCRVGDRNRLANDPLFEPYLRQEAERYGAIARHIQDQGKKGPGQADEALAMSDYFQEVLAWLLQWKTSSA